jgi:nucleotide-binding universal stress UspA family protein
MSVVSFAPSAASPLIVATDGRAQSDSALRAGATLAKTDDAMRIITVVPPLAVVPPELDFRIAAEALAARREAQLRAVNDQVRRLFGPERSIRAEERDGNPADVVSRLATEANASLIVAGLGRHRVVDRVLGDETALQLIRSAATPVLSVAPDFAIPRIIMVGFDFSENSVHAAQLALRFAGRAARGATVYLMHVAPRGDIANFVVGGREAYEERSHAALQQVIAQLEVPPDVLVQPVVRQGDPATQILEYAADTDAAMIAIGTRGLGFVARMFVGSVATKIIRASPIAVLTVPS